jgi:hypothetical protein
VGLERSQRARLVGVHETAIAHYVISQDGG